MKQNPATLFFFNDDFPLVDMMSWKPMSVFVFVSKMCGCKVSSTIIFYVISNMLECSARQLWEDSYDTCTPFEMQNESPWHFFESLLARPAPMSLANEQFKFMPEIWWPSFFFRIMKESPATKPSGMFLESSKNGFIFQTWSRICSILLGLLGSVFVALDPNHLLINSLEGTVFLT